MTTAKKVLTLAATQIGVKESPKNSNNVKYNTAYYGREITDPAYAWCVVFIWWLFRQQGAADLFYGGGKTASCTTLYGYHKNQGQRVTSYQPGDLIFFNFSGKTSTQHIGICESWDGENITTIDGNTGSGSEANGGAVMRRTRGKQYIVGAYRPRYGEDTPPKEEPDMTKNEVLAIIAQYEAQKASDQSPDDWAKTAWEEMRQEGLLDGTRPMSNLTRQELALVLARLMEKQGS